MAVEVIDVRPGLWLWRQPHPDWDAGADWEPEVSSYAVTSGGVRWLVDPLAPPPSARAAWERIDAHGADAYGPSLFWPRDVPRTGLEPLRPGKELPGGLRALHDGRGMHETPLYLP